MALISSMEGIMVVKVVGEYNARTRLSQTAELTLFKGRLDRSN